MNRRYATIVKVGAAQYAAVGLGIAWGLGAAQGVRWLYGHWAIAGGLAIFMLSLEGLLRSVASWRTPTKPLICMGLASYAGWLIRIEAFLWYVDNTSFVVSVLRLLPFLLAMSPLVRAGAWLGVAGAGLFFATALAMLTDNGFHRLGGSGFFENWVS